MSKSDKQIWLESLDNPDNANSFTVKPGGIKVKPLPKRNVFKTSEEKKTESRIKDLEKQVENLTKELKRVMILTEKLKSKLKANMINEDVQRSQQRPRNEY